MSGPVFSAQDHAHMARALQLAALGRDDDTDVPEPADDNIAADPVATLGRAAGNGGK